MTVVRHGHRISTRQEVAPVLAGPVVERARRGRPVEAQGLRAVAVVGGEAISAPLIQKDTDLIDFYFNFAGGERNSLLPANFI